MPIATLVAGATASVALGYFLFDSDDNKIHAESDNVSTLYCVMLMQKKIVQSGSKPSEVVPLLIHGIQTNRLIRLLDKDQQAAMVSKMEPIEYNPGDIIMKIGNKAVKSFFKLF